MSYTKQVWSDFPSGGTPISAARLNHMEEGIASAGSSAAADAAQATANTALSTANTAVTKANNAQAAINAISATTEPITGGFTPATGWSFGTAGRGKVIKIGRIASCDISVVRTGSTIIVGSTGNIPNTLIGTVSGAFANWGNYQGLVVGPGGSTGSFYIQGTNIYIAAYAPNSNIAAGQEITCAGPWITAS